jgi:hypothetical protein
MTKARASGLFCLEQNASAAPCNFAVIHTSAECRKIAAAKLAEAKRLRDERRANHLISAANAWLILAHGVRRLEINREARKAIRRNERRWGSMPSS